MPMNVVRPQTPNSLLPRAPAKPPPGHRPAPGPYTLSPSLRMRSQLSRIATPLVFFTFMVSASFLVFPRPSEANPAFAVVSASCGAGGNDLGPLPCTTANDVANGSLSFPFPAAVAVGGSVLTGVGTGGEDSGGASATASAVAQIGSLFAAGAGTVPPFTKSNARNPSSYATVFSADAQFTDFFTANVPTHYTFTVFPDPVISTTNLSVANINVSLSILDQSGVLGGTGLTVLFSVECVSGVSNLGGAPCSPLNSALHPPPLSLSWVEPAGGSFSFTADLNLSGSVVPDCSLVDVAAGIVCNPSPTPVQGSASATDPLLVYLDATAGYTDASGLVYPTSPTSSTGVPEPGTFGLFAVGLSFVGFLFAMRRQSRSNA